MKIRTLIVDDEVLSRRGVEIRLRTESDFEIVAQCANGREALGAIQQYKPDLVFLDIQMPGLSGFEVLAHLPQESLPVVVFITAYDQYAIQAFEARAIDYLLKPIDEARFAAALARVREHVRARSAADQRDRLLQIIAEITGCGELALDELLAHGRSAIEGRRPEVLPIRQGRETVRVQVASIQWIDAAGDYMCIHAGGDTHILRGTMKELEDILDPRLFQRVLDDRLVDDGRHLLGHRFSRRQKPRAEPRHREHRFPNDLTHAFSSCLDTARLIAPHRAALSGHQRRTPPGRSKSPPLLPQRPRPEQASAVGRP